MHKTNNPVTVNVSTPDSILANASGPVEIPMVNDYMFRATNQENPLALKGLIASVLHMDPESIRSVVIQNPIVLGKAIDEKTYILDLKVRLNNHVVLNLEMQVINEHNWPDRSLLYLCRAFDSLNKGMEYDEVKPAIQVGLLNFTLFPEAPGFFATYKVMNTKTHQIYSDKLSLLVIDLTKRNIATEEDRSYGIDQWAAFYQATTWEEIKMLAQSNPYIRAAAETTYTLSQEEIIRMQCDAREEYYAKQRANERLRREHGELQQEHSELQQEHSKLQQEHSELRQERNELQQNYAILASDATKKDDTIQRLRQRLIDAGIQPDD